MVSYLYNDGLRKVTLKWDAYVLHLFVFSSSSFTIAFEMVSAYGNTRMAMVKPTTNALVPNESE